ncbi:hypothetical protein MSAN_00187800 [Mycena sanguinolenta]|uniref:Uncharacterized protein n=1 Tax=Mycena sanguinolenta TaxID=230812 RepID=A0A8H7DJG0_9AGAR|nr:hypothetical protein MSAN_00187800 [Mycena sanguinolenta]
MSSATMEDLVVLQAAPPENETAPFNSALIMEEGRIRDIPSSGNLAADPTIVSLSRRIAELELELATIHSDSAQLGSKITPWRLLNTCVVLGLGIYKATAGYRGQDTALTTTDWVVGILWALIAYWLSFFEDAELGPEGRWFFTHDVSGIFRKVLLVLISLSALGLLGWALNALSKRGAEGGSSKWRQFFAGGVAVLLYLGIMFMVGLLMFGCQWPKGRRSSRRHRWGGR